MKTLARAAFRGLFYIGDSTRGVKREVQGIAIILIIFILLLIFE